MLKKIFLFLVLIFFIGCGSEKAIEAPQEPIKEDDSSMSVVITDKKTGDTWIQILVPDDATDIQIAEKMAEYVKKHLDDGKKDFIIHAYGDQRFWNKVGIGTHGYTIVKNGQNIESFAKGKNYIPSEDEKELYIEYYHAVSNLIETGEKEKEARETIINIMSTRKEKSKQDIEETLSKVENYLKLKDSNEASSNQEDNSDDVSYEDFKKVKGFEYYLEEKGKNIKVDDKMIQVYLKQENINMSVEDFKKLQHRVIEWDKNRNK
ncbi:hypothetical protein JDFnp2_61 [Fusobacterium phage JD-Fnp2]|nr:hypothetical protein JDFnp2_61 [Fusobacterium phage JD-Fnp2]UTV61087.1 hypothetical protein JDFnp3_49 [Fusobacterium phage JD-Fnp3]UTV61169.1 hypothetical protein JDFnp5_63 [Fusobacterium phage JD-Fnp5]